MALITDVKVINKPTTKLDVVIDPVVVEDSTFITKTVTVDDISRTPLFSDSTGNRLTIGDTVEIISINSIIASPVAGSIYELRVNTNSSPGGDTLSVYYYNSGYLIVNPNTRYTIPTADDEQIYVAVNNLSGSTFETVRISFVFKVTPA